MGTLDATNRQMSGCHMDLQLMLCRKPTEKDEIAEHHDQSEAIVTHHLLCKFWRSNGLRQ